jgi:hypothetical protein
MEPNEKPWWKSKMLWVNVLGTLAAILVAVSDLDFIKENPQAVAIIGGIIGVVNVILRAITKSALAFGRKSKLLVFALLGSLVASSASAREQLSFWQPKAQDQISFWEPQLAMRAPIDMAPVETVSHVVPTVPVYQLNTTRTSSPVFRGRRVFRGGFFRRLFGSNCR